jgi:hypothetical protein
MDEMPVLCPWEWVGAVFLAADHEKVGKDSLLIS